MIGHATISIVTPVLNGATMLQDALVSLQHQARPFEHIVVDGGSTDGSQKLVAESGATLIEAPRSSLYEALNLGLERACGDIIGLLNCDDLLEPGALELVRAAFAANPSLDIVKGKALERHWANGAWLSEGFATDAVVGLGPTLLKPPQINACFFSASFWRRVGPFDATYAISADREWLARAVLERPQAQTIDRVLYVYRAHSKSMTIGGEKPATERWVREHLNFGQRLLVDKRLSNTERASVRAFFAKETVHALLLAMRRGDFSGMVKTAASSTRRAPLWPLEAIPPLTSVLLQRWRRSSAQLGR